MVNKQVSLDEVVATLNRLLEVDPPAVRLLVESRVPCGTSLVEQRVVQTHDGELGPEWGILGLLNAFFGVLSDGTGPIAGVYNEDDLLLRFIVRSQPDS